MNYKVEEALARLEAMADRPMVEYRDAITDELCTITGSTISYFAVMDLTETTLTMIGWSKSAMSMCQTIDKPIVYKVEETGLWGDAARERNVVITNDYPNLVKPTKKGYPMGHVEVLRHMNLPIFEGDHMVLVVGVGNKPDKYTSEDVQNVLDLMQTAWQTFSRALWTATW